MTLVEVLVAALVISVGVLGVTGLQMTALQANRAAFLRTEAALMAEDMMERIRANATATGGATHYDGLGLGDPPPPPPDCGRRDCTARDVANFDRAAWKCRLGRFRDHRACVTLVDMAGSGFVAGDLLEPALPDGDGGIEVDGQGRFVRVETRWREGSRFHSIAIDSRI